MTAIILYRQADTSKEEIEAINEFFPSTFMRTAVPNRVNNEPEWLVIGRYSVLPYYQELIKDLAVKGARLINSHSEHLFVADVGEWSDVLAGLTPRTWRQGSFGNLPGDRSFVLKGQTNSRKFLWDTHMFAKDSDAVSGVFSRLLNDTLIGTQTIYAREYIPLITYTTDFNGLPITKEFRFFVLYQHVLCGGYYWSSHEGDVIDAIGRLPSVEDVPEEFLQTVIKRIGDRVPFYVVDIAQSKAGQWLVTDLNDGQMSGLSQIAPRALYMSMHEVLNKLEII